MESEAAQIVKLPFMDFFSPFPRTEMGAGVHILTMLGALMLALYGLYYTLKYSKSIGMSKNTHLIAISFTLLAFMPVLDILEHSGAELGYDFLNHISIFTGVAAFLFLYKFGMNMDSAEQEAPGQSIILLLGFGIFSGVYAYWEVALEGTAPLFMLAVYAVLVVAMTYCGYLLLRLLNKIRHIEKFFSLKIFVISMVPIIAICLYLLCLDMVLAETATDLINNLDPFILKMMYGLEDPLFLMVAMTMVCFAYMGGKIQDFYMQVAKFARTVSGNDKASPVQKPPRAKR